ncbi:NADH:ubiquinone oxidoreductase subunit NDUFA12 [Pseudoroseicyclus aestuarii]|uniref:NADH:ubiquinone oxidoreductase subunit n=1 Tax=Pseudoroseicyclus aestuarii TaxID=1795041 RepID=A0A318T6F6_9RHOB|nr:NADH:ubiquinone oxidoreductase subunit NDUFA12 [Pseudoroseicyclus aestuarii]PYE86024.1 NADH:ubiquinone oxidoreductase subunit [Pseudoroseicyclus aestuarii]
MSFLNNLKRGVTWWNGSTLNTQFWSWRHGTRVGEDAQGNVFYRNADGSRRWVIYNGEAEASRVSPEWHGWLHHTYQDPPTIMPMHAPKWSKPHEPNYTGSDQAYVPPGSIRRADPLPRSDYDAWSPE